MKRTTIKDVAKKAGVSITTVSHALSGGGVVKQETRERIRELAREMNYMPDWRGKNLKSEETNVIGLYVQFIRGFYGQLADAMYDQFREAGYELNVFMAEDGDMLLDSLLSKRVDGAIILHAGFSDRHAEILRDVELPTVFLDREMVGTRVSSVLFDSYQTGRMAAEYLYGLGHRRVLFIKGRDTYDGVERCRGFMDYLGERGCQVPEDYQIRGNFDRGDAFRSTERFLNSGKPLPTAVFAANDDSAIGCMLALASAGYSVPKDISVIGCDNIELGHWYIPALTTLDTRISYQAVVAAKELVSLVQGEHEGRITKTACELVERDSCIRAE